MRVISGKVRGAKLESVDDVSTRPTLDRVKESLFNIINNKICDAVVLDLFAGSGAIGIEFLSRGCMTAYFCDKSKESVKFINKNLKKTKLEENAIVSVCDYKYCLKKLHEDGVKLDFVYIDPPYNLDIAKDAVSLICKYKLLNKNGIIIVETDEKEREVENFKKINVEIYDCRKYGRVHLIFLTERS